MFAVDFIAIGSGGGELLRLADVDSRCRGGDGYRHQRWLVDR